MKYCMQAERTWLEWDRDYQEARLGKRLRDVHGLSMGWGQLCHPRRTPAAAKRGCTHQPRQAATGAAGLSFTPPQSALVEPWNGFSISQTVSYQMTESIFKEVFASLHFV